jgi:phosphoserine phosphatase
MIVASDLNGTLTTGSPILAVAKWAEINQASLPPKLFKIRILLSYLQVKFGLKDLHVWADKNLRAVLGLISSPTPEKLTEIMTSIVEDELWPKRRPEAIALLRNFHQQGAEIILVSAAFEPAVAIFGEKIVPGGISGVGTPIFIKDGKLFLADELTVGEKKMDLLSSKLGSRNLDYALGDTIADLPMLKASRNPIAVVPDHQLRALALEQGWKILE